jgi:peptide/nickel transport system permease protein
MRRLGFSLVALAGAMFIVFSLSRLSGDPRLLYMGAEGYGVTPEQYEALGKELALDKPFVVQYLARVGKALRGDLGQSIVGRQSVTGMIRTKLPNTLKLAAAAWLVAIGLGIPLGVLSAVKRGSPIDYLARGLAVLGQSMPGFWIGIMAILLFAVELQWLPSLGRGNTPKEFVLPVVTLAWLPMAGFVRLTRSSMLDVLDSEFVKLARAKGVSYWTVVAKHAFRNALIVPLTLSGLLLANLMTGSVVVESVFSWPGIGRLALQAVSDNDFPVLSGVVVMFTAIYLVANFLVDLLYAVVDPRIRLG